MNTYTKNKLIANLGYKKMKEIEKALDLKQTWEIRSLLRDYFTELAKIEMEKWTQ